MRPQPGTPMRLIGSIDPSNMVACGTAEDALRRTAWVGSATGRCQQRHPANGASDSNCRGHSRCCRAAARLQTREFQRSHVRLPSISAMLAGRLERTGPVSPRCVCLLGSRTHQVQDRTIGNLERVAARNQDRFRLIQKTPDRQDCLHGPLHRFSYVHSTPEPRSVL